MIKGENENVAPFSALRRHMMQPLERTVVRRVSHVLDMIQKVLRSSSVGMAGAQECRETTSAPQALLRGNTLVVITA